MASVRPEPTVPRSAPGVHPRRLWSVRPQTDREAGDAVQAKAGAKALRRLGGWIGLFWVPTAVGEPAWPAEVLTLAAEREVARKDRNFKASDELRDKLKALGVAVEDGPQGQRLKPLV